MLDQGKGHEERLKLAELSLTGLSVGDAFGERFFGPSATVELLIAERSFPRTPWRWTDDTAMALSVVEVLRDHRHIDRAALAKAFAGRYADDPGRGYGPGAYSLLHSICLGTPWKEASREAFGGQGSFGNGGAMRSSPVGAYFWDDYRAVVENGGASADPTHAHPEGRAGAIAVAMAAATAARMGQGDIPADGRLLFDAVLEYCPDGETAKGIARAKTIPAVQDPRDAASVLGNGSQVSAQDTVPFCLWSAARHINGYEEALWNTVYVLGDRDTTCAIVGGIVALAVGRDGISKQFLCAREPLPGTVR